MIVMEHSCRLKVLCFLAKSDYRLRCPCIIQLFSPVSTLRLLFQSFFFFFKYKAYQQILQGTCLWMENLQFIFPLLQIGRSYACTVYSVALESDEFAELTVLWIHTQILDVVYSMLYCLYNIISVLGPFFSVLASPFSVNSIL